MISTFTQAISLFNLVDDAGLVLETAWLGEKDVAMINKGREITGSPYRWVRRADAETAVVEGK